MIRIRDVFLTPISESEYLVITCDSCGGIGNKEHDIVKVDPFYVGYFTTVVALAENLAIGGEVLSVVDTLSLSMVGDGEKILEGVQRAMEEAELSPTQLITGSTEENIPVTQTAIGVTVIGKINKEKVKYPKSQKGDLLVLLGLPKMGNQLVEEEILQTKSEIIKLKHIIQLSKLTFVKELIPVGSKGIDYECQEIASLNHCKVVYKEGAIDLNVSAGPGTCVLITIDKNNIQQLLTKNINIPINIIGELI
ncbi:alpha-ribazole kinase [Natranaerovirga pectinivora]|uniref:Alpha-ribazole kinase n=1 Tax=Natranaerovirga pectinivora TaxID=682400 RepID=A0A4R3MMM7_9FIRM|nr:AIR synthase related protein [Natranaerovirga pectinivora]TCT15515.1 alpha-ribazole kinase [Natranaerovirga pectinivora]